MFDSFATETGYMKQLHILLLIIAVVATGCGNEKREAEARFAAAQQLYESAQWAAAKQELDSLKILYPKQVAELRKGLALMRTIELKEQERHFFYCDSLLTVKEGEAHILSPKFVLEKDEEYQEIGQWVYKNQRIERNVERTYLRSNVSEKGDFALVSVYFGKGAINHNAIKASINNGDYAETSVVLRDGGNNYAFTDNGNTSEIVSYITEKDGGVTSFIVQHLKDRIKIEYKSEGKTKHTIYLADSDRMAISETFEYAAVLSDIEHLKRELEKSKSRMEYLKLKLSEGQNPTES